MSDHHYIDVATALNRQVDKMLNDEQRYRAGLFYQPDAKTPELKNLKTLGFSKLTLALIIAEVVVYGGESDKAVIKKLYQQDEISNYMAFADKTIADRVSHVNAHRVNKADDETYGFIEGIDEEKPRYTQRS